MVELDAIFCCCFITGECLRWCSEGEPDPSTATFTVITDAPENEKRLMDETNTFICIICSEEIDSSTSIVECHLCHKYVGHVLCVNKWFEKHSTCPYCRGENIV